MNEEIIRPPPRNEELDLLIETTLFFLMTIIPYIEKTPFSR